MSAELIERSRSGDQVAFEQLVGPHRHELQVHCYRILGSVADSEDALQETLTSAWRGLAGFEGGASIRTWLYRIATSRCLNMLRSARRRPPAGLPVLDVEPPEPSRLAEVVWLEPYPDVLLDDLPDSAAGPDARYEAREAISLAFVTALQLLPPRQRVTLILREVLDFSGREVADLLNTSEESVASSLKRARANSGPRDAAGRPAAAGCPIARRARTPGPSHPSLRSQRCRRARRPDDRRRVGAHASRATGIPGPRAGRAVLLDGRFPTRSPLSVHPDPGERSAGIRRLSARSTHPSRARRRPVCHHPLGRPNQRHLQV